MSYESPWVDDHDPLCPPYLGAREGRAECAICEALERARAGERERIAQALAEQEAQAAKHMTEPWQDWSYQCGQRDAYDYAEQIARGQLGGSE